MQIKDTQVLVLSIDHYRVQDENGKVTEGTTAWYYANPELTPQDNGNDSKGVKPAKLSLDTAFLTHAANIKVPCLALVDFVMRPDSKGKMQLTATNFRPQEGALKLTVAK